MSNTNGNYHSQEHKESIVNKIYRFVGKLVILAIIGAFLFKVAPYGYKFVQNKKEPVSVEVPATKRPIQDYEYALNQIGELNTYEYNYKDAMDVKDNAGMDTWFPMFDAAVNKATEHEYIVNYAGIIKVGYELADIELELEDENTLLVKLPEGVVTGNEITDHDVIYEDNNILNKITADEVLQHLDIERERQLKLAIGRDLYKKAEDSAKRQISEIFSVFDDVTVKFI